MACLRRDDRSLLIERYLDEQRSLDEQLTAEHEVLVEQLNQSMSDYLGLLERAFSPDVQVAFVGSVELAVSLGVATGKILDSEEKVDAYFLDQDVSAATARMQLSGS
ncbi:hypothetical protein AB0H58_29330 [Nocardia neocaledoniensis]|uniref:hypothetical protein n=1 Tax=Nocardia neocaledoniensis TaxID=236511 RepID=UPI003407A69F